MILTIDIGTSTFKSALWDYDGNRLSFFSVPLFVKIEGNKHEAEPSQWINAFEKSCQYHKNLKNTEVIIISGNGPSLVPITGNNSAQTARLWLDRRAEKYQEEVSQLMGGFVDARFFLPKILYLKNEETTLYNNTKVFTGCPEYLAYILTGQAKTVFPCDGFDRWFWNDSILEKLDLDTQKFPPFIRPGELFGTLTLSASEKYGFNKNIPVLSGGPDFYSAILGSGVTKPGQVCDRTGTSEGINLCTEDNRNINGLKSCGLMSYGHPIKPYWNLSGIINSSGKAIEEACVKLNIGFNDFFELSKNNEYAKSVLENICYEIKNILNNMETNGAKIEQLFVTGGLSGNDILNQLKADITGKEILIGSNKEAELLGLYIIGSCYLGKYKSFKEASEAVCRVEESYEPNNKTRLQYQDTK